MSDKPRLILTSLSLLFSSISSFTLKSEAEIQKYIALCKQVEAFQKGE